MSPLLIEILLHYHSRTDDYRGGDFSAPAVRDAIDAFRLRDEMLMCADDGDRRCYKLAARGRAFVEHICSLPLPVMKWEIPQ